MARGAPKVVVAGAREDDALARLGIYLQQHLPGSRADRVPEYLDGLRRDILANRKTDIYCTALLQGLSAADRATANALISDIHVLLTQRRTQPLRDACAGNLSGQDIDRLFQDVCLGVDPPLDPDLPKVAAQVIVHCSSQRALIERLSNEIGRVRAQLHTLQEDCPPSGAALLPLGRLLAFLRWVPYEWAEELALDVLDTVRLPDRTDRLRLWISILRIFFCLPSVGVISVNRLLQGIDEEFGWPAPMELRNLVRTLLIKGGENSQQTLLRRFDERPEIYETGVFLDHLAMIDKPAAAGWLLTHKNSLIARLGVESYLALLTKTGETGPAVHALLVRLWDDGQTATRLRCLDAIETLHYADMTPFLLSRFNGEEDPGLRFRLVETVAVLASGDDLRSLAALVRNDRSALRYYTMYLIHRRLLDTPALLTMQNNLGLLEDIQHARADLYTLYRSLLYFRKTLLHVPESEHVGSDAKKPTGERPDPQAALKGAVAILRSRKLMVSRIHANIFGVLNCGSVSGDLLDETDIDTPAGDERITDDDHNALTAKTERSIAFLLDFFLWQEWFVREIPFVLSEEIEDFIDRVRRGDPLAFDLKMLSDPGQRDHLRNTFGIFCECARQGLYLTDVMLTHISHFVPEEWPHVIRDDLTRRRVMVADGRLVYHPGDTLARHLQFTTFAHDYRYGKESLEQPALLYLWLRYIGESRRITAALADGPWPSLPSHPDVPDRIGPLMEAIYAEHAREAKGVADLIVSLYERAERVGVEMRVIPNLTYGLFCLAPVLEAIVQKGIHISLAGVSSQFCDDENINRFSLRDENVFPLKRYVFSNASNYGTLNGDRILVVVDGTMEPIDRHDATRIRLPKAYRGFVNHLAAVNYVRARYGYRMENPERDVASALNLPQRFVRNLLRTNNFRHLVDSLLLCFDPETLAQSHAAAGTGKTYYTFAQWNPDGMPARVGPIGYRKHELPCLAGEDVSCPSLLFVSMNSIFNESGVAAYFDNNPEVEHPRMFLGPRGVKIDIGWPESRKGIEMLRGP